MTLDKIIYQMELCRNTLSMIENRVQVSEGRLAEMMEFIKNQDLNYQPKVTSTLLSNSPLKNAPDAPRPVT